MYVTNHASLSMYAAGRTTGTVIDSGYGETFSIAVIDGYCSNHTKETMEVSGGAITDYAQKLLLESGHSLELESVKNIKETLFFVAQDYATEHAAAQASSELDQSYTLPDSSAITVKGSVRMQAPELLFMPALNGKDCGSIHMLAYASIMKSDVDKRHELFKNVILSGGTTMFEGIADRLKSELTASCAG